MQFNILINSLRGQAGIAAFLLTGFCAIAWSTVLFLGYKKHQAAPPQRDLTSAACSQPRPFKPGCGFQ